VTRELLSASDLAQRIETDGALDRDEMNLDVARLLDEQVWVARLPRPAIQR